MKRGLLVGMGLVLVGGVVTPAVTPVGVDTALAATLAGPGTKQTTRENSGDPTRLARFRTIVPVRV